MTHTKHSPSKTKQAGLFLAALLIALTVFSMGCGPSTHITVGVGGYGPYGGYYGGMGYPGYGYPYPNLW